MTEWVNPTSWESQGRSERVRLICTKLGHHNPRDLGSVLLYHDASNAFTISIENQMGRPATGGEKTSAPIGGYWSEESKNADNGSVHIWCHSCRQDMRFKARDFGRLVRETPRANRKGADVSVLWAILMKQRHTD